jgi:cell division protein FtsQ
MELPPGGKDKYSFPVIAGMNAGEPRSIRSARMKNYNELVRQLDSDGARYSQELSEVDLSDSDDVKVVAAGSNGDVLVHLGSSNYLPRYRTYVTHVQQWRQQFSKLESVDLRYDGQIIVNPDLEGMPRQPALTPAAAKAALAAGVKQAAIVNYEKFVSRPPAAAPAKPTKAAQKVPAKHAAVKKAVHGPQKTKGKPAPAPAKKSHSAIAHTAAPRAAASPKTPLAAKILVHVPSPTPAATKTSPKKPSPAIRKEAQQD